MQYSSDYFDKIAQDAGDFYCVFEACFFFILKNVHMGTNNGGGNGREIVRGNWYSLQHVTVQLSWSGKLLGSLLSNLPVQSH